MATRTPHPCQVGLAWSPSLPDLDVALVFRRDTEQWFLMNINDCDDIPLFVSHARAMETAERKEFHEVKHDKHGRFEVAFFARMEPCK